MHQAFSSSTTSPARAWGVEEEHKLIVLKAIDYLKLKHPEILERFPLEEYVPWLMEGITYADGTPLRACGTPGWLGELLKDLFRDYPSKCLIEAVDTMHQYGEVRAIDTRYDIAFAHPGSFAGVEYAPALLEQARVFWPGGDKPDLGALGREDGGYLVANDWVWVGVMGPRIQDLGYTDLGGVPYCSLLYPNCSTCCPRWPHWVGGDPTKVDPNESVRVSMIYLGWAVHIIEDLTVPYHALNKMNDNHNNFENRMMDLTRKGYFDHLPVYEGGAYLHTSSAVAGDVFWMTSGGFCIDECPPPNDSYYAKEAYDLGVSAWKRGIDNNPAAFAETEGEALIDASIKLVAAQLYSFFYYLPDVQRKLETGNCYYITTSEGDPLHLSTVSTENGALMELHHLETDTSPGPSYTFCALPQDSKDFYLQHVGSDRYVATSEKETGARLHLWGPIPAGHEDRYTFRAVPAPDSNWYLIHKYSEKYACVDLTENLNPWGGWWGYDPIWASTKPWRPLELYPDATSDASKDCRFRLTQLRTDFYTPAIVDVVNAPPALVVGLRHNVAQKSINTYTEPATISFLPVPGWFYGGDLGSSCGEGYEYWMLPDDPSGDPSDWKLPAGVVFALKHFTTSGERAITLFGHDPGPKNTSAGQDFAQFERVHGGDMGGVPGQGYYWYESTGAGFDWSTDRVWADRLPKGTVIGLKHSENNAGKKLIWNSVEYDSTAASGATPPGYTRWCGGDNVASAGNGYCWYEKTWGVSLVAENNTTVGVLGSSLHDNSRIVNIWWQSPTPEPIDPKNPPGFELQLDDPRLCQAYCYSDPTCTTFTYYRPNSIFEGSSARCSLYNYSWGEWGTIKDECCVSGGTAR